MLNDLLNKPLNEVKLYLKNIEELKKIEDNLLGTLIVLNKDKVVGMLTDGDIRKLLIAHHMLTIPVKHAMNRNYIYLNQEHDQDAINQLFDDLEIDKSFSLKS